MFSISLVSASIKILRTWILGTVRSLHGSNINVRQRQDRKAIRRKSSSPQCNRHSGLESATPPHAPAPKAVTRSVSFSSELMPEMPFFAAEQEQQLRKLRRRRRSTATATATVTQEERTERRNLMKSRILEEQHSEIARDYELGELSDAHLTWRRKILTH